MKHRIKHPASSFTIQNDKLPAGSVLQIDAITDNIIRIHTITGTQNTDGSSFAIENPPGLSGSFDISSHKQAITAATSCLTLKASKSLQIDIYDKKGNLVCAGARANNNVAAQLSKEEISQLIQEGHMADTSDIQFKYKATKKIMGDESFYGLGDKTGFLDKKGYDYIMWNSDNPDPHVENPAFRALYKSVPFFIVRRQNCTYGIFLDNTYKSYFDFGCSDAGCYSFGVTGGELDYYFIYGKNIKEVIKNYTSLTGRSPLPQLWTLGYHQSRWSYSSED